MRDVTVQAKLLNDVITDPLNCAKCLAYADWLDTNDEPGYKEHAKLIKWQCAATDNVPTSAEMFKALITQLNLAGVVISKHNHNITLSDIAREELMFCGVTNLSFVMCSRGFVNVLSGTTYRYWELNGPKIVLALPIKYVSFEESVQDLQFVRIATGYKWPMSTTTPWIKPEDAIKQHASFAYACLAGSAAAITWAKKQLTIHPVTNKVNYESTWPTIAGTNSTSTNHLQ